MGLWGHDVVVVFISTTGETAVNVYWSVGNSNSYQILFHCVVLTSVFTPVPAAHDGSGMKCPVKI